MAPRLDYRVGVDGGGSGTRVRLADADGRLLAQGHAGPSALALGADAAWCAIGEAIEAAFAAAGLAMPSRPRLALGLGLAGANHRPWADALHEQRPPYGAVVLDSDARTSQLGAFGGGPGAVIAVGTGSVGLSVAPDGSQRSVGGWGFPVGDEGSGAWIGQRAVAHATQVQDGRRDGGPLAEAIVAQVREEAPGGGLLAWMLAADQRRYATLAPLVLAQARHDPVARQIVGDAAAELGRMALTLDPGGRLPLAWCGGLAAPLWPYLSADLRRRSLAPRADAATGALLMLAQRLDWPMSAAAPAPITEGPA